MKKLFALLALILLLAVADTAENAEPCITHKFVSGIADSADTSQVRPSDWNACHVEGPKVVTLSVGCPSCAVIADTDDFPSIWLNDTDRTLTITQVTCKPDAGSPTIQLQRDDGSATNMFTAALTCNTTPSGNDGTDGILTTAGFVTGENILSPGHWLNLNTVTAGGVAKMYTVSIKMTVPAP